MSKQSNVVPLLTGDTSTAKQRKARNLNWAKFMVDGMEAQLKYLVNNGAIDPVAFRMAASTLEDLRHSIAYNERMAEIDSAYRRERGL